MKIKGVTEEREVIDLEKNTRVENLLIGPDSVIVESLSTYVVVKSWMEVMNGRSM